MLVGLRLPLFVAACWTLTYPIVHYVQLLHLGGNGGGVTLSPIYATTPHARGGDTLHAYDPRWDALSRLPKNSSRRVAWITFSFVPSADDPGRLVHHLLAAVDTWAAPEVGDSDATAAYAQPPQQLYVVLTFKSRVPFEAFCGDSGEGGNESNATMSGGSIQDEDVLHRAKKLCRHLRPIYVDCPEGKSGESPCCKQEKGLAAIIGGQEFPLYDWYAFFDDDIYLRKEYIAGILATFSSADFPMAVVAKGALPLPLGRTGYHQASPQERCSRREDYLYPWGQPIFYSRGALLLMAKGYRAGSLVKQCLTFGVTHDVGNALLNWMYNLPVRTLPNLNKLPYFRDDFIGSHWAGRQGGHFEEMRTHTHKSGGRINGEKLDSWSFHDVHEKWGHYPHPGIDVITAASHQIKWYKNVTGFYNTFTFEKFGEPHTWEEGVWHTMNNSECRPSN